MTDRVLLTGELHMPTVFEKLNLKNQTEIVVLNPPALFEPALAELDHVTVHRDLGAVELVNFSLAFAMTQAEVDRLSELLILKANGDALLWFAYPKGTSKKYQCDFNRDTGWAALQAAGFDTVRQISIDEDWTALRFRRVQFIKSR